MGHLREDLRVALRGFRHQPGFTAVVVLTLAIGLGANTAIFALVDVLLLRSLPVERPEELYRLGDNNNCCVNSGLQTSYSLFSYALVEHLRENADAFTDLAAFQASQGYAVGLRVSGRPVAEAMNGEFVSGNYFRVFGVTAAAGRLLQPDDDRPGAPPVVVLSYRTWSRLGLDPRVIGSAVIVNGTAMTVAGVTAPSFYGDTLRPDPTGAWIPLAQEPALRGSGSLIDRADQDWLYAIGRLRRGASPEQATARMTAALQQWLSAQSFLSDRDRPRIAEQRIAVTAAGGGVQVVQRQFANPLTWLFITSAVLLLIATANLANLLLARADRGQAAIRAALGASGSRLMRQAMTEGIVLAAAGALVGLLVAPPATSALISLAFPTATFVPVDTSPSVGAVLFAAALAIVTGLLFTGGPAWAMSRTPPLDALSGVGRSGHARSFVPRRSLVIAQVALSFSMIASAALFATSLNNLEQQPLGFTPDQRLVLRIDPPLPTSDEPQVRALLYTRLQQRLQRVPGVAAVSYSLYSPMEGDNWSSGISIAGRTSDPASPDSSSWNRVGPGFFETVGTRLMRGRAIDDRDVPGAQRVAVVSQEFVRQFLADKNPLGQHLGIGDASHARDFEIVGVVDDVKYSNARRPVRPMIFLPGFQSGDYADQSARNVQGRSMLLHAIVVQTASGAANIEPALRAAIAEVDPNINVLRVLPMTTQVSVNFRVERLLARLTSLYGLLALALACLGLYGVTTYTVAQRTREIGVRMALGADRTAVMRSIVGAPLVETLAGLAIGIPLALTAGRAMSTQLFGLGGQDPWVLSAAIVVLVVTTAIAAAIPAMRAASLDPVKALRRQ
jgi:predicted permease